MTMANFFSKYFSELALMATAMLWAGCNVDKDSKNEKSVSDSSKNFGVAEISKSVDLPDSTAQNVSEKDDSISNEIPKDSLDANSQTVVLLDSARLLEVQRTRDSLMKAFFPIERTHKEKKKWGLQYDLHGSTKRLDSVFANLNNVRTHACYYGVIADRHVSADDNLLSMLGNSNAIPSKWFVKVLYEKIESADKQTLDQDMFSRVKRPFRQKTPGLRHLYRKFLKKNSANTFEGVITLKLTITADGTVKESSIKKSTTGVKDFDEEIRSYVNRWIFSEVKSGTTVVYVPIRFYE